MNVPACATGCKEEDAVPFRHLRSKDTPENVVVRYGAGSWPEAGSGLFSAGQQ